MDTVSVVIPTYQRSQRLLSCLRSVHKQLQPDDEIVVVARVEDTATQNLLSQEIESFPQVQIVTVTRPGMVAALNAGCIATKGDIIAFVDDDVVAHCNWLKNLRWHFEADAQVGGVGGRDWIYDDGHLLSEATSSNPVVGIVQWHGRMIGNHHLGVGAPREVHLLKGANMSFRRVAFHGLQFDERLRGSGAQVHCDMAFSLSVRRRGWKLIYDPQVSVDHHRAQRFDEDQRHMFHSEAFFNAVHNQTLTLLEELSPLRRTCFLAWSLTVGTRDAFGLVQWVRFVPTGIYVSSHKLRASWRGLWAGWQTWRDSLRGG